MKLYLSALLVACILPFSSTSAQGAPQKEKPLFERLGGKSGINALVGTFVKELSSDDRLTENASLQALKSQIDQKAAQARLSDELCKSAGGPCKPTNAPLLKNQASNPELGTMDWVYILQNANEAMDQHKLGLKERKDLVSLLMKAREKF